MSEATEAAETLAWVLNPSLELRPEPDGLLTIRARARGRPMTELLLRAEDERPFVALLEELVSLGGVTRQLLPRALPWAGRLNELGILILESEISKEVRLDERAFAGGVAAAVDPVRRALARAQLAGRGYARLGAVLRDDGLLRAFQNRYRRLLREGYFTLDRQQVVGSRLCIHNEPGGSRLHAELQELASDVVGEELKASYCYLVVYQPGAELKRHTDREQCAWNMSICIESGTPAAWPICFEPRGGGPAAAVELDEGEAVLYSGTDIPHWRDRLEGGRSETVLLLHFVPKSFRGPLD